MDQTPTRSRNDAWRLAATYAAIDGYDPRTWTPDPVEERPDVDRWILSVLQSVGGVRRRAAAILGIDRKTLYRKLEVNNRTQAAIVARDAELF